VFRGSNIHTHLVSPERLIRSHRQHQHPPILPAAVRLSKVLDCTVKHVVPAARRGAGAAGEDGRALVAVEGERDEDGPEHGVRAAAVGVDLLLVRAGRDAEERGVDGVVRRETPGPLALDPARDALEPRGLEASELGDLALLVEARAVDGAARGFEAVDGREHARDRGDVDAGDGERVALHWGCACGWMAFIHA
jgi:hypothetical protein